MTAKTSENLATILEGVGLHGLAERARSDEFHDYLSNHTFPEMVLEQELRRARDHAEPIIARLIEAIRQQHLNGDFDASKEESDDWAASDDGQDSLRAIIEGRKL